MENKSRNVLKYVIITLILSIFLGVGFFAIWYNIRNQNSENTEELKDFDITVISYLNLMPMASENNEPKTAYFAFALNGIDQDSFLNEYKIESIELNGSLINTKDVIYEYGNGFRFYSSNYKKNNTINLIISNKNTNIKYLKKLKVSTKTVM